MGLPDEVVQIPVAFETVPSIIKEVDMNEATIMMVDSNLQRGVILPSEKAKAYKMKLDAIKCQGARTDLTSDPRGRKSGVSSREMIAENSPDSSTQIHRYIRLNELIPELLELVDDRKMAISPAAEVSYLTEVEQKMLLASFLGIRSPHADAALRPADLLQPLLAIPLAGRCYRVLDAPPPILQLLPLNRCVPNAL